MTEQEIAYETEFARFVISGAIRTIRDRFIDGVDIAIEVTLPGDPQLKYKMVFTAEDSIEWFTATHRPKDGNGDANCAVSSQSI